MDRILIIILSVVTIFSCTKQKPISLMGSWYYIDHIDSAYYELHFSQELMLVRSRILYYNKFFFYKIEGNQIFISYTPLSVDLPSFKFKVLGDDIIKLSGKEGEFVLHKCNNCEFPIYNLRIGEKSFDDFCEEFYLRERHLLDSLRLEFETTYPPSLHDSFDEVIDYIEIPMEPGAGAN
jgi:hypothetical protein